MQAERNWSLYYLCGSAVKATDGVLNATESDSGRLWHLRMGHPSDGGIKELIKKGVIYGNYSKASEPCEECVLGKAKKQPYPKGKHTSLAPLDYAHSDLCGPSPINYMTTIDDYSRKM